MVLLHQSKENGEGCHLAANGDVERSDVRYRSTSPVEMKRLPSTSSLDENKERGNWSSKVEFLLSCLSYAVGLGNIWRFPYLCYRNGGGAFLIPYTLMLICTGLPLFFFELSFGQYASEGPITIWKICPLFQGVGYGMFLISVFVGIYYNVILSWAIFYLFSSFTNELPWSSCDNWWNTKACRKFDMKNCTALGGFMGSNGTCLFKWSVSDEEWNALNETNRKMKMPADEYFHNFMLDMSEGIHDIGKIRWSLALCLLLAWVIVFVVLLRGVKSVGKAVYFTALFPYMVLVVLLIRAATLPGYIDGILFYLTPEWGKLAEAGVWADACVQIFFSLGPCWGGLITLSSYNQFKNNCYRDALTVASGNCLTSFFAGFVIFGVLGFMAHELGVPVKEVAAQGAGLAFIAYPEAVARLPLSPLWSILFFVMLLTLGMGTQFTVLETVVTTIVDEWPHKLRGRNHKWVLAGACTFMYICGLSMCTQGGMYVFQLVDNHAATFSALIIGMAEVFAVAWIYGAERFLDDIKSMLGHYPRPYQFWRWIWRIGTPVCILFILVFTWADYKPTSYGDYVFPDWANSLGWFLSAISVSMLPIVAIIKLYREKGPFMQRLKKLSKPTDNWGPALKIHRDETVKPKHIDSTSPLADNMQDDEQDENGLCTVFEKNDDDDDNSDDGGLTMKVEVKQHETGL